MLTTQAGIEITVQCVLRVEAECVAIRGRLSGSQDAGRIFFIPYNQIDHIGFMREMKESEFHEDFAGLTLPGSAATQPAVPTLSAALPVLQTLASIGEEVVLLPSNGETSPASRPDIPIKSEVLERFRNRSGSGSTGAVKPSGS